jgi:hypothetical protein
MNKKNYIPAIASTSVKYGTESVGALNTAYREAGDAAPITSIRMDGGEIKGI